MKYMIKMTKDNTTYEAWIDVRVDGDRVSDVDFATYIGWVNGEVTNVTEIPLHRQDEMLELAITEYRRGLSVRRNEGRMVSVFNILRRTPARRGLDASNWSLYYQHDEPNAELPAMETYSQSCQEMPEYEWKLERLDRTILETTATY